MHQTVLLLALTLTYSAPVISQNATIVAPSGTFYSPNYPSDYDNNIKMTYNITVPKDHYIYITLMDFVTEAYFDVLTVYDGGNSTPSYALSGDCTGQSYALSSSTAIFEFTTDLTGTAKGFAIQFDAIEMNASYTLSDACPSPLYNSEKGFVTSPNWPYDYYNSLNCTWTITSTSNRVQLNFAAFNTEALFDVVTIYDGVGGPVIATLSGDPSNLTSIITTRNVMYINFVTDLVNTASGFSAFYQSIQ